MTGAPSERASVDVSPDPAGYWHFYWPLALTGIVSLLAHQLQNATLARYPNAAYELANFAIAAGVYGAFDAALIFLPQLVNVMARSPASRALCLRFILVVCFLMTLPVVFMAVPGPGHRLIAWMFDLSDKQADTVALYLALLSPNIVFLGLRHYCIGLIVQARHTRIVTVLNLLYLAVTWGILMIGLRSGWKSVITLAVAQLSASIVHLLACGAAARKVVELNRGVDSEPLTWRAVMAFFWPVAITSFMFSLSRPILYLYLARLPQPEPVLASMRVGFDFSMMFHNLLNQFRHLFVTFGKSDLPGVRRFMARVTIAVTLLMIFVAFTPLSVWLLQQLIGVEGEVLRQSRHVLMVLCAVPLLVSWRNYHHGLALTNRQTGPMGFGAILRNIATYIVSALLYYSGHLTHITAASILLLGFIIETLTVIYWPLILRRGTRRA